MSPEMMMTTHHFDQGEPRWSGGVVRTLTVGPPLGAVGDGEMASLAPTMKPTTKALNHDEARSSSTRIAS